MPFLVRHMHPLILKYMSHLLFLHGAPSTHLWLLLNVFTHYYDILKKKVLQLKPDKAETIPLCFIL